jgi:hypothetical protein
MQIQIRCARPEDAAELGRICYQAFKTISEAHNFPPDIPSAEAAAGILSMFIAHPAHHN